MSGTYFAADLDTVATWWRVYRRDGVTLGFTTHDRDLWFGGVLHRAAPGIVPSAIRRTIGFEDDESDVEGAMTHSDIREQDLVAGRFDNARVATGVVNWETGDHTHIHAGTIGTVTQDAGQFGAHMRSAKAVLDRDPVPVTGPSCRARFCGPGCGLNPVAFETISRVLDVAFDTNRLTVDVTDPALFAHGELRFLDGPQTGPAIHILAVSDAAFVLDRPLANGIAPGQRVRLRQGCDHTVATCASRFANAINFRGEPFLPGNDMLAQYPVAR